MGKKRAFKKRKSGQSGSSLPSLEQNIKGDQDEGLMDDACLINSYQDICDKSFQTSVDPEPEPMEEIKKNTESISRLFIEAESALDSFLHDSAAECCKKILNLEPDNVEAMEMLGGISLELGSVDEAKILWLRCVERSPNSGSKKYFSLAQMSEGDEALEYYRKGISILQKQLEETENAQPEQNPPVAVLKRTLSDGFCAIAELYMTDLCEEETACSLCKAAIDESISVDPKNPDAYRILASFSITEEKIDEAKVVMQQNLSMWFDHYEAMRDKPDEDIESEIIIPEYMTRVEISKVLIELEMFEEATKILEGLMEEDDEVFIVWYILGWLNYNRGDIYLSNAMYYFKKADDLAKKTGEDDSDQAIHITELLSILKERGIQDEEDCGNNDEELSQHFSDSSDDENMES